MFSRASVVVTGGTWVNNNSQSKRGFELLMDLVATDAMHDSDELYDAPKCHPNTRIAVLDDIMKWVVESEALEDFIMWLYGPAGAGKSAIAKRISELAADKGLLIGSFFFSRTSSTRNVKDRLITTLAYQLALSIPGTRTYIEDAIDRDPAVFKKNLETQINALLIKPFQSASLPAIPFPKLIIIDGLDECSDSQAQVTILNAISRSFTKHKLPIIFLAVSRPEVAIVSSFTSNEPLKSIHRRLALDDNYHPDDDIRLYLSDKFEQIRSTHRLRSTILVPWPTEELLEKLVKKASGQFIFAATVIRFVESMRHRPAARLNIILGKSPASTINPFTELDVLYKQILSSVDSIQLTLHVLSLYTSSPDLADYLNAASVSEHFLSLEEGDIELALMDLSSIVSYNELSGTVKVLHASFVDFLSDPRRSGEFYIDMASARTDFTCRTLQLVKGPEGIRAGDFSFFIKGIITGGGWILNDQLRSEILNFDLGAFIAAVIDSPYPRSRNAISLIFDLWMSEVIPRAAEMGLEDRDVQSLYRQCRTCFESRLQRYQSDWHLRLLLTVAVVRDHLVERDYRVHGLRYLDILLEMEDHKLHLADRDALELRYSGGYFSNYTTELTDITSRYVDGDEYASAALHCMRFLSNPPTYSETEKNDSLEMGVNYDEWKETCRMTLGILCRLLERANTSPEVMQFMTDHDIDTIIQKTLPVIDVWRVDACILGFLSRGDVCVNWRIISAILRKQRDSRKHMDVSPMRAIRSTFRPQPTPRCPICPTPLKYYY